MSSKRLINFAAGPAKVPEEVLKEAQEHLLNYPGYGASILEMSHRSSTFINIMKQTEADLRDLLNIPQNYAVLFMHGGGVGAMSSVPMNLSQGHSVDYILTGTWSQKAAKEAAKYAKVNSLNVPSNGKFTSVPNVSTLKFDQNAKYVYYCDNETIHGVEYPETPVIGDGSVPLVVDMTSNFLSRPIDVSKYGCIFAGTQKNAGVAALVIVIVRKDLISPLGITPAVFDYNVTIKETSLQNTPPVFAIYVAGLCFKWMKKMGGVAAMGDNCKARSSLIYNTIDSSNGFYFSPVEKNSRSRITIPFRVGGPDGNEELEKKFLKEAEAAGMIQLKGHRSVGGIRASMYNAMTIDEVQTLAQFMKTFMENNK